MSLVTRCPSCGTTFRVLPAQLAARGGRVRCGQCDVVFDGVNNLLSDTAIAGLAVEPSPQLGLFEGRDPPDPAPGGAEPPPEAPSDAATPRPTPEAEEAAPPAEPIEDGKPDAPVPVAGSSEQAVPEPLPPVPGFLSAQRPSPSRRPLWVLLGLVAAGVLALQAALVFRTEVAVLWPAARPHLETACAALGCDFRLPRRADLMSIESSDLQADPQRQGVIVLNALLRNRAPFAQEYPDLELTLTDQGDQPVVRRVLQPADYLQEKPTAIAPGLGGGAEEAVRVRLDTAGIVATGYQLFLFYPCPPPSHSPFWQLGYPARCQATRNK